MYNQTHTKSSSLEKAILQILSQPTAPFRESWVQQEVLQWCQKAKLSYFEDRFQNIWVNVKNQKALKKISLVFVAHLDHPGMVVEKFYTSQKKLFAQAHWLGGGPLDIRNHHVRIFSDVHAGFIFKGIVKEHTKTARGPQSVLLELKDPAEHQIAQALWNDDGLKALGPWGACLWYKDAPNGVVQKNNKWVTKAADDLIGVCVLLESIRQVRPEANIALLLSRAEESGFHGTMHILNKKYLDPNSTLMISVESSAWRPHAELGKGPVLRLGDKTSTFDPTLLEWMKNSATHIQTKDKSFQFQRRIMDGGTCEATAFNSFGFQVAGLSCPLENYHNINSSNSKTQKAFAEAVHVNDARNLTLFLSALMKAHKKEDLKHLNKKAFKDFRNKLLEHHFDEVKKYN